MNKEGYGEIMDKYEKDVATLLLFIGLMGVLMEMTRGVI